jgi:hypothetical protein
MNKFYIAVYVYVYVYGMHNQGTVLSHNGKYAKNVAMKHLFIKES